jgi:predicted transcriptional regulator
MTITIRLPEPVLHRAQSEAQSSGKTLDVFIKEAIEAKLARRNRTLSEVFEPIDRAVEASGLCETEVEVLLEQELKAHRLERRAKSPKL